jgi:lysine 2,3-aminomutase
MWREELRHNIRTVEQLKKYIPLTLREERQIKHVIEHHPMNITRYYMSLIDKNDPHDPLKKMIVPSIDELDITGSYDPSGEAANTVLPGLQHKYAPTALILTTNRCTAYCRHCFRKRLIGLPTEEIIKKFDEAVKYITQHTEINNVLLSGGDPFTLSTNIIKNFVEKLVAIPHLKFIRFGTRTPVMAPDRINEDEELLSLLQHYSLRRRKIYVSTQFNHPRELTKQSIRAVNKFIRRSIAVNNQTVLLKGVNDDPNTMADLQNMLAGIGVIPYYVFQCRPVKRVKYSFQVPIVRGLEIMREAKRKCSGYSKRFRYVMSHRTGKIEILAITNREIYFKYHEAKDPQNNSRFFKRKVVPLGGWLDDFPVIK